jgi:hypothetical protein
MRIASEMRAQWGDTAEADPLTGELIPARDYSGLNDQDTSLRLWLPDQAKIALTEVCERLGIAMTVYLTEFFATYLYGVHEVMRMRDEGIGLYQVEEVTGGGESPVDSTSDDHEEDDLDYDDPIPEMGKNIFSLKIFLPSPIKAGLQQRANLAKVPLGRFARAMICAHLFGRDVGVRKLV